MSAPGHDLLLDVFLWVRISATRASRSLTLGIGERIRSGETRYAPSLNLKITFGAGESAKSLCQLANVQSPTCTFTPALFESLSSICMKCGTVSPYFAAMVPILRKVEPISKIWMVRQQLAPPDHSEITRSG